MKAGGETEEIMKAPAQRKQFTIRVGDDVIKIKARRRTQQGNPCGFKVTINECTYYKNHLDMQDAIESAYVEYVKANR